MSRAKYTITAADVMHATLYLGKTLSTAGFTLNKAVPHETVTRDYHTAVDLKSRTARAAALNAWCEEYLDASDWGKLKMAIRQRRHRWDHDQRTVTISPRAHALLIKVAERDQVTFSEVLEHYLRKALNASRGRATKRSRARKAPRR